MGSEDAKVALLRAYALLDDVPQHPAREPLLFRLGFMLCLRAEHAEALALAERIEALAQKTGDPALLIAACTIQGEIQFLRGNPPAARQWLERGLAACDSLADAAEGTFIADPRVTLLGQLAIQLLHLGLIERAASASSKHAPAERRQAIAEGVAIWSRVSSRYGSATPSGSRCWQKRCARLPTSSRSRRAMPGRSGCAAAQARSGDPNGGSV
jgi:hypothetical protein